jgi:hypothetical protein
VFNVDTLFAGLPLEKNHNLYEKSFNKRNMLIL